jgi:aryl-alcohol dehydrogenase-like predicted oxidoreductase
MRSTTLGPFEGVSRLTLGGGGLGRIWGETEPEECIATVRAAVDAGLTLIDTAPMYGDCEEVIGLAFQGALPPGVRITTKCQLGEPPPGEAARILEASLDQTLAVMGLDRVDIFFLHSNLCDDDYVYARRNEHRAVFATPWSLYTGEVVPALDDLQRRGRIGAWGITGVGVPAVVLRALAWEAKPAAVQAVANLLDSPGGMQQYEEDPRPREIIAAAKANGVGVLGIRAVQAGALTAALDRAVKGSHPEARDYARAAPWRALCAELGQDPARLAHRYALSIPGVDSLILGVKNRAELRDALAAETAGPLSTELLDRIDALGLRTR